MEKGFAHYVPCLKNDIYTLLNDVSFLIFHKFCLRNYNSQKQFQNSPPPPLTFFIRNGQKVASIPYSVKGPKITAYLVH